MPAFNYHLRPTSEDHDRQIIIRIACDAISTGQSAGDLAQLDRALMDCLMVEDRELDRV